MDIVSYILSKKYTDKKVIKPRKVSNIDDFTFDNALYQNASNFGDSSAVLNTTTKELTITEPISHHKSAKAHKVFTYGKNLMINTVFKGDTTLPQIHLRINQKDPIGALIWFQPTATATIQLQKVNDLAGGFTSLISPALAFDGDAHADTEVSVRSFGDMSEMIVRQGGIVRGMFRNMNAAFGALSGVANGLGAHPTSPAVYRNYVKTMELNEYINIICLGDSNTAGNGLTTKQTYPALLQGRYFEHNVGVINKGISGNKVADVTARLAADVYANKVTGARNIVVLNIGVNDAISAGTPANTIYSNIVTNLIAPLKASGFEVWLCTIPAFTSNVNGLNIVKVLNPLILADTNADKIIDFYSRTVDTSDTIVTGMVQGDNLHLTETATNILASLVANELST